MNENRGWPWGDNRPTPLRRFALAVVAATIAAAAIVYRFATEPTYYGDFSLVWFGARSIIQGISPYPLVGPGLTFELDYSLLYPATAFVAAMPLAALPQAAAVTAFVWISTALLVYGMTADSWHRLPILVSLTFLLNVYAAQWTILLTARSVHPGTLFFCAGQAETGMPVVASASSSSRLDCAGGRRSGSWGRELAASSFVAARMACPVVRA